MVLKTQTPDWESSALTTRPLPHCTIGQHLNLIHFGRPPLGLTIKLNCWSRDILNFHFFWKSLGLAFQPQFQYDFLRKIFLMLYTNNWPNSIVWLTLFLEIWEICVSELNFCQSVDLAFSSSSFPTWSKY